MRGRVLADGRWLRTLRTQIENKEATSSQDLVQTVLLMLLELQRHRDLDREQDRVEDRREKLQASIRPANSVVGMSKSVSRTAVEMISSCR